MLQFYCLAVIVSLLSGLILIYGTNFYKGASQVMSYDDESDGISDEKIADSAFKENVILDDMTFRLVVAIVALLVGIIKLICVTPNDVAVVGDLLPVLACLASGATLLIEYFNRKSVSPLSLPQILDDAMVEGRKYIGICSIIIGVLHFIFPGVLFL